MDDSTERKIRDLEEWNKERSRIKPVIERAVDCHNKARVEVRWKNYDTATGLYKEAIKYYKDAIALNPKYYLQDLMDRVDHVIEEYINNAFRLKTARDELKSERGIKEFMSFVDRLKEGERRYINTYELADAYLRIANLYYDEEKFEKACEFYNKAIDVNCEQSFINRESYFKIGKIFFEDDKFKEALMSFVSVLSFDRGNEEVTDYIDECLKKLKISEYRERFLVATPNEAKKLIMEVL
ncbi:MAG: tetratricopeptide repeat protein [Candidatus Omnitrophica bacterium]|nr:tetratricopeptide repeat protein [Candidatus Omnitrophota bacterium]